MKKAKGDGASHRIKFAHKLVTRRKERGYKTAYAFFHEGGGEDKFGFSYHHYLLLEKGQRLPSKEALRRILNAIGGKLSYAEEREELLNLYVRALLDGDPIFKPIFEKFNAKPQKIHDEALEEEIIRSAARQTVSNVPLLTGLQADKLFASPALFWSNQYLMQSGAPFSAMGVAAGLGYPKEQTSNALEELVRLGLAKKNKDGTYVSSHFETDLFTPSSMLSRQRSAWMSAQIVKRCATMPRGEFYGHFFIALEDETKLSVLVNLGREFTRKAYLYRPKRPVLDGTLVSVECRISPLADIGND